MWGDSIELGLVKMRQRGALARSANPHELAVALLSAVQGGLLLSKTTQTSRPLEIAIDMAIDHIARHMNSASEGSPQKKADYSQLWLVRVTDADEGRVDLTAGLLCRFFSVKILGFKNTTSAATTRGRGHRRRSGMSAYGLKQT